MKNFQTNYLDFYPNIETSGNCVEWRNEFSIIIITINRFVFICVRQDCYYNIENNYQTVIYEGKLFFKYSKIKYIFFYANKMTIWIIIFSKSVAKFQILSAV